MDHTSGSVRLAESRILCEDMFGRTRSPVAYTIWLSRAISLGSRCERSSPRLTSTRRLPPTSHDRLSQMTGG